MRYGNGHNSREEEKNNGDYTEDWRNLAKLVDQICFVLVLLAVVALFVSLIVGIAINENEIPETSEHFKSV